MWSTKREIQLLVALTTLLLLALAAGCQGFFVNPTLTSIAVGPGSANVPVGSTQQMTATGTYDDGSTKNLTADADTAWLTSDPTVATITKGGLVKGIAIGTPTITAEVGTVSGQTTVNITLTNVTGITISPSTNTIKINGGTATFQALATVSGSNQKVDVSAQANWTITNSTHFTLTQGVSPETVTTLSGANIGDVETLTATYTTGTSQFTATAQLTVTQ